MRRIFALALATVLAVGAGDLLCAGPASAAACVTIPGVAHRGGIEHYVENTDDAFRDAANRGTPRWETDVQFTADDVPVIMHDDTVDRTTDGTGAVSSFTLAQLEGLRTSDDQAVPTLAQIVNDAQVDGATIFPELKTTPTEPQWTAFLAALASRPTIASRVVVTSFDGSRLVALRAHTALYRTGLLQNGGDQTPESVTQYAGTTILIKVHDSITGSRMAAWTAGGLTVYAWTVDTESEWARMAWYPALAGVITNDPAAYLAWQKARTC
jgi:glycerophosphoryl diester phosphodiesterase